MLVEHHIGAMSSLGPEGMTQHDGEQGVQRYPWWSGQCIKKWIRVQVKNDPNLAWIIDDYCGQLSYEEEGITRIPKSIVGRNLTTNQSREMRCKINIMEDELHEVTESGKSKRVSRQECRSIIRTILSICDDYMPMSGNAAEDFEAQGGIECKDGQQVLEIELSTFEPQTAINDRDCGVHEANGRDEAHVVQRTRDEVQARDDEERTCWKYGSWNHPGQEYNVKVPTRKPDDVVTSLTFDLKDAGKDNNGFDIRLMASLAMGAGTKTKRKTKVAQPIFEDEESDEEDDDSDQLVCNMAGNSWESLPYPIIIDSGACASVMPTSWCKHVPIEETDKSKAGEFFRAADGRKIFNEGRKLVILMTREGIRRDMNFIACDVSKALGSVSQMCRTGHRVVFNPPWEPEVSYIEHTDTGEKMWLIEQNGLYVLETKVAPKQKQTGLSDRQSQSLGWQVHP